MTGMTDDFLGAMKAVGLTQADVVVRESTRTCQALACLKSSIRTASLNSTIILLLVAASYGCASRPTSPWATRFPPETPAASAPPSVAPAQPRFPQPSQIAKPASPSIQPPASALSQSAPLAFPDSRTGRNRVRRLLPTDLKDRDGWATDLFAALSVLQVPATTENICAVIAVTEQESLFEADPHVPGLPQIAEKEMQKQLGADSVRRWALDAALSLRSRDGRTFRERLDRVRTERELSEIFEELISLVPMGNKLLAGKNPIRTGGAMQVSVAFAEEHARIRPYPYHIATSIRREVFTRRGSLYFGTAHLLDYPTEYAHPIYRFADYNAGRYASRNAAFQTALSLVSGIPIVPDGDLLIWRDGLPVTNAGATVAAASAFAQRLGLTPEGVVRDLLQEKTESFATTPLYQRTFELATTLRGQSLPVPVAVLPRIDLKGPKIKRPLTTEWFASRVDRRYRRCLDRSGS